MATQSTVWIVISCDEIARRLRNLIDAGQLSEVNNLSQSLDSFAKKINNFVQVRGGRLYVNLYERQILEVPVSIAKDLPNIIAGYKEVFKTKDVPVGMGLNFEEAVKAMKLSRSTHRIELYSPSNERLIDKSEFTLESDILPPNLYDTDTTQPTEPAPPIPTKQIAQRPDAQTELANETNLINAISQQIGGAQIQQQMKQQQQQVEQIQQQQQQPRDLMEALHGDQLEGHGDQEGESEDQNKEDQPEKPESGEESEPDDKQVEKLYQLMSNIQNKIPALMDLHDKNPEAFKHSMALIQKLLNMTKTVSKKSEKLFNTIEEIEKAFKAGIRRKWPVGTVIGKKRKVRINNKDVWRDVSAGQVLAPDGQPVSVLRYNSYAADAQQNDVSKGK